MSMKLKTCNHIYEHTRKKEGSLSLGLCISSLNYIYVNVKGSIKMDGLLNLKWFWLVDRERERERERERGMRHEMFYFSL